MEYDMTIYERADVPPRDPKDLERLVDSLAKLDAVGIHVRRVFCNDIEDMDEGEAKDTVKEQGLDALPIAEYQGVEITNRSYPDDQDLADFLDVPDGVLSVNRMRPPGMANDLPPCCACGNRTK